MERLTLDELKHFYANKEAKEINVKIVTDLLEKVDRYLTNIKSYDFDQAIEQSEQGSQGYKSAESSY